MLSERIFRALVAGVLLLSGVVSAYYLGKSLLDSGSRTPGNDEGWMYKARRGAGLVLLVVFFFYFFYPHALDWAMISLPEWMRVISAALALGCIPMFIWVFRSLGKNVTVTVRPGSDPVLVRNGPYRFVRHPLYATMLVLVGSLGVVTQIWVLLVFFVLGWTIFRYLVVPVEETHLEEVFGEAYQAYRENTGAMFPRLF